MFIPEIIKQPGTPDQIIPFEGFESKDIDPEILDMSIEPVILCFGKINCILIEIDKIKNDPAVWIFW